MFDSDAFLYLHCLGLRFFNVVGLMILNFSGEWKLLCLCLWSLCCVVVMLNELVNFASRYGKSCFMFKIEFEKVYNFIKWGFLDYTLGRLGFDLIWQGQIKSVVCSSYLSMLVNGSLTKEFEAQRGLKQGDPLAPFLFIIVVEA